MVVMRKMKEKCKDAARMRREKERIEFVELSKLLPLPTSTTSQLDKASIIRLTSSYLRMRTAFPQGLGENWGTKQKVARRIECAGSISSGCDDAGSLRCSSINSNGQPTRPGSSQVSSPIKELGSLLLQTLDGFVFALHRDGKIMYISETASVHLGLPQIDLTGSSVFDYIHPADHNDIMSMLELTEAERSALNERVAAGSQNSFQNGESDTVELGRSFCMRMKCVLPKRNAGLVNNGYKAIHCSGYLKARCKQPTTSASLSAPSKQAQLGAAESQRLDQRIWDSYALVAVGHSLLPTASTEIKLGTRTFMFRANLDLRIYYIETAVTNLLGYQQCELVGQSMYQMVHIADLSHLELAHKQVLEKGQVVSRYHRLMRQNGGSIWIQLHATLINNPRSMPRPQHIVGICCVIGEGQFDQSRSMLIEEPATKLEPAAISSKKPTEKSKTLVKKLKPKIKSSAKILNARQVSNQISRKNRHQRHPMLAQQLGKSKSTRIHAGREQSLCNLYQMDANGENSPTASYLTIGSTRRPSDDTCSINSSIASTISTSSSTAVHNHNYGSLDKTTLSSSSSPPNELLVSGQNLSSRTDCLYQAQNQTQHYFLDSMPSIRPGEYSDRVHNCVNNYAIQDQWPVATIRYDEKSLPISIDTSCDPSTVCWNAMTTTATSPSLTASTVATSRASGDGSPIGLYTMSPEHSYVAEHCYYGATGQTNQPVVYNHNDYIQTYSTEAHIYTNYTRSEVRQPSLSCDDQYGQSYYYAPHQETACSGANVQT